MEKLVYIFKPNLFYMLLNSGLAIALFLLMIGFIVYKLQNNLGKSMKRGYSIILFGVFSLLLISNIILKVNIYQKAKKGLAEESEWTYISGKIEHYNTARMIEHFTIQNHYFDEQSMLSGYNPHKHKPFKSIKKDILQYSDHIKIAYIDERNPIILKIWIIDEKIKESDERNH